MRGNHDAEDAPGEESFTARLPEWARERENGQWYGPRAAARCPQQAKPKAPPNLIVVLSDESEPDWAKARVFDDPGEAAALVETLMEGGLARERLTIFSATLMVLDVAYQPLVEFKES